MAIFKCKMCGGDLQAQDGACVVECGYCGTKQTVSATDDEKRVNLYNRANHLRMNSEFDKAASLYEQIVAEFPNDAEAYWGLCLCNYGIEYVDDPVTSAKIPTIHRASFEKMRKDENYERALENADATARLVYQEQAKEIDRIMGEVLAISQDEKPYDIFICYKETDEVGGRTVDSVIAQNIYDVLTDKGYKVFFSRITLEDKLGAQYEPYIFAALNSAKVMLAVGTDYEYYNAVWVKNEWRRFWKLAAADKSKVLIPCYKDMDAYDLPNEFKGLQAQDMGKVGAMQDLLRGIDKIFGKDKKAAAPTATAAPMTAPSGNVGALLKRAFMFLEDGEWQDANIYCEKVLDQDPENGNAYFGKLLAELRVKKPNELKDFPRPFDQLVNYQKVLRFGDDNLKNSLISCNKYIIDRNESERQNEIYDNAVELMGMYGEKSLYEAAEKFRSISGFKDADEKAAECEIKAEEMRKEAIYNTGKHFMTGTSTISLLSAIIRFEKIPDYKDSAALIEQCQEQINILQAKAEEKRIEKEKNVKKRKKKFMIMVLCFLVLALLFILRMIS